MYSVLRHPDDTYALTIKNGGSWMSVDGGNSFIDYIPIHLRAWFTPCSRRPGREPSQGLDSGDNGTQFARRAGECRTVRSNPGNDAVPSPSFNPNSSSEYHAVQTSRGETPSGRRAVGTRTRR